MDTLQEDGRQMSDAATPLTMEGPPTQVDPLKVEMFMQTAREGQDLKRAILLGLLTAVGCSIVWAAITFLIERQYGLMAVGIGFVVATVVRNSGKGIDKVFGFWSAGLSLLGCVLGNLLALAAVISRHEDVAPTKVLAFLLLTPSATMEVLAETFSPIDLLFYGLAVYYGYKHAFRRITNEELGSVITQP